MEAIQFINITPTELSKMLRSEITDLIKEKEKSEELLTQKEVANFYKVSVQTIINWKKAGIINVYNIGNEKQYKKSKLINNLKK